MQVNITCNGMIRRWRERTGGRTYKDMTWFPVESIEIPPDETERSYVCPYCEKDLRITVFPPSNQPKEFFKNLVERKIFYTIIALAWFLFFIALIVWGNDDSGEWMFIVLMIPAPILLYLGLRDLSNLRNTAYVVMVVNSEDHSVSCPQLKPKVDVISVKR
jgi:uncharacterized Zn-finger protein